MGWFNPKLEPGERVLLRYPAPFSRTNVIPWVLAALLSWVLSYIVVDWIAANGIQAHNLILTFLLPVSFLGDMVNQRAWNVAVTDRRLLVARGWRGSRPWAAVLGEIESVSLDYAAYLVRVRTAAGEIEIHPDQIDLEELTRTLASAKGALA